MTDKILIAAILLALCWLIDRSHNNYRGRYRRIAGSHRNPTGDRGQRALLTGMHRPDMYGKETR